MERRTFIGAAAATLALSAAATAAAEEHKHEHGTAAAGKVNEDLLKATAACLATGRVCLTHCITQLGAGDKTLEACAKAVNQMLALCDATNSLAAQNAALLAAVAKQCAEACKQCAEACKEHADHHAECKACLDACLECVEACNKIAA
ncbi:four-helix bundle copper-binding protein [uncultured Cardiobacterium sp.]|uniref:four-helix bundle copper-binding protein n=1 Tax=uncultured Cardiobacterium sp. TaxID=417619 RepID=UPI00261D81A6|nr:four-helix bundle copper-binding protein [uncultured Cardiobacterium sp.]